jgi:hypothetical protein
MCKLLQGGRQIIIIIIIIISIIIFRYHLYAGYLQLTYLTRNLFLEYIVLQLYVVTMYGTVQVILFPVF